MRSIINLSLLLVLILLGCTKTNDHNEKFQYSRDNIINVKDKIVDVKTEIVIGWYGMHIINNYLLISDLKQFDMGLYLFDKNTFKYICSTGRTGKGPGEIVNYMNKRVVADQKNNSFFVLDYCKNAVFKFDIDSVLVNEEYLPNKVATFSQNTYLRRMKILKDSVFIGRSAKVIDPSTVREVMSKYNYISDKLSFFGYQHPNIKTHKQTGALFAVSKKHKIYVNCYFTSDLMTICNLEGSLKYNVYGPGWEKSKRSKNKYFGAGVSIIGDKIIVAYSGTKTFVMDKNHRRKSVLPTKLLIFDIKGNYLKTLETGCEILRFCADEENNRLLIFFSDREIPLGYIDLKGIV